MVGRGSKGPQWLRPVVRGGAGAPPPTGESNTNTTCNEISRHHKAAPMCYTSVGTSRREPLPQCTHVPSGGGPL